MYGLKFTDVQKKLAQKHGDNNSNRDKSLSFWFRKGLLQKEFDREFMSDVYFELRRCIALNETEISQMKYSTRKKKKPSTRPIDTSDYRNFFLGRS